MRVSLLLVVCVLAGCSTYQKTADCQRQWPSPFGGFGLAQLTPDYQTAAQHYGPTYDHDWNSNINACIHR